MPVPFRARGRVFTSHQLERIKEIVDVHRKESRTEISRRVCRALRWRQKNGRLKDMACREVLRKLEATGFIRLPAPRGRGAIWPASSKCGQHEEDPSPINSLDLGSLAIRLVSAAHERSLWNRLVENYHYIGSSRIVGRQLKYLVLTDGRPIACLGYGDACWAVKARDQWIGWKPHQLSRNRHLIVNNTRFLILPWVNVQNLASYILAKGSKAVHADWRAAYGYAPLLLETFVDTERFSGTCYRAANWLQLGMTAGYAKTGSAHRNSQAPKAIFVYPLRRDFKEVLKCRMQ